MAAFKQRGIMVLAMMVFLGVVGIEAVRSGMGWPTTMLSRALIAGSVAGLSVLILRHFGFKPFARSPRD